MQLEGFPEGKLHYQQQLGLLSQRICAIIAYTTPVRFGGCNQEREALAPAPIAYIVISRERRLLKVGAFFLSIEIELQRRRLGESASLSRWRRGRGPQQFDLRQSFG